MDALGYLIQLAEMLGVAPDLAAGLGGGAVMIVTALLTHWSSRRNKRKQAELVNETVKTQLAEFVPPPEREIIQRQYEQNPPVNKQRQHLLDALDMEVKAGRPNSLRAQSLRCRLGFQSKIKVD